MITSLEKQKLEAEKKYQNLGFSIRKVGIGDGVQFTSLPENFYRHTGSKLIDISKPWYLDHNPYVLRDREPKKITEMWNYPRIYDWPKLRNSVYLSNAEIHASLFDIQNPKLTRPRLYRFEDYPFEKRHKILFHTHGASHGALPNFVIDHVLKKYKNMDLYHLGLPSDPDIGIPKIETPHLWDLVKEISECKMLIGVDSGPAWIAACYPDVIVKKIRTKFQFGFCEPQDWVPLDVRNEHSFWDDSSLFKIYNCFEEDVGFTKSYREL